MILPWKTGRKKPEEENSSRTESSSESEDSSESGESSESESSSDEDEAEKKDDEETEEKKYDNQDKVKPEKQKKGADHLRLITTAVSPFVLKHKKKQPEASISHVDEKYADEYVADKAQEHEKTKTRSQEGRESDGEDMVERFKGDGSTAMVSLTVANSIIMGRNKKTSLGASKTIFRSQIKSLVAQNQQCQQFQRSKAKFLGASSNV